jgi:hypothetical protein
MVARHPTITVIPTRALIPLRSNLKVLPGLASRETLISVIMTDSLVNLFASA